VSRNSQALSESSVVGPRASVVLFGEDGEAGDIGRIVDAAGRSPDRKKAARSQIELSDRALQKPRAKAKIQWLATSV